MAHCKSSCINLAHSLWWQEQNPTLASETLQDVDGLVNLEIAGVGPIELLIPYYHDDGQGCGTGTRAATP